ncbi:sensitivity to red-light reduced protein [Dionaea muscipula]
MAAAGEIVTYDEDSNLMDDWIVVLPRHRKRRRTCPKLLGPKQESKTWVVSTDLQFDTSRYAKAMQKVQVCLKKLEKSKFFDLFMAQVRNDVVLDFFARTRGSESNMHMVIYGIGSIESFDPPRLQLSLAILMKREIDWIGDIEVFDPVLSATESRVLEALGCTVLTIDEQARRKAVKPTLFFMPHCEAVLYNNLLEANWEKELLSNMVLFGNSFEAYEQHVSVVKDLVFDDSRKHILAAHSFADEFRIETVSDDYFKAFHETSWHFFSPDAAAELTITDAKVE